MTGKDIKNLLTFAAFRPEADDSQSTWAKRFPKEATLLLNVNRSDVSWACVGKGGRVLEHGQTEGALEDVVSAYADNWREITDNGWCSVSLNNRFVISLESNLSRKTGWAERLKNSPKTVLGTKFERGKKYALQHHPENNSSILMGCEEGVITQTEQVLKANGLNTGRICCGIFSLLTDTLSRLEQNGGSQRDLLLVICLEGSACVLKLKDGSWAELRSRSGLYQKGDFSPVVQILTPMLDPRDASPNIVIVADHEQTDFVAQIQQKSPGADITEASSHDRIWKIIGGH